MQIRSCPKDPTRVDENGRAFAGSQRWIQYYVNYRQKELNEAIIRSRDSFSELHSFRWVSPLESDDFTEYRDEMFLGCLGLSHLAGEFRTSWPRNGPCWDALALVRHGDESSVLLVEAKSYPNEFFGNGCGAGSHSLKRIENTFAATKTWAGASPGADWLGRLYQSANRLAHLYCLRERFKVATWLVNVCFTGDPHRPTSVIEWRAALPHIYDELGLPADPPFVSTIFLPAEEQRT